MFRLYEQYETRDFTIDNIHAKLKERELAIIKNRGAKASLSIKLDEMGISKEQLLILIKQKSEKK